MNVWFDHGTGEGGTILDLGAKLHECSMQEFIDKLSASPDTFSFHRKKFSIEKPENKLVVISVRGLVNPDLIQYLTTRKIDIDVAKEYCKEVEFRIGAKVYKPLAFQISPALLTFVTVGSSDNDSNMKQALKVYYELLEQRKKINMVSKDDKIS